MTDDIKEPPQTPSEQKDDDPNIIGCLSTEEMAQWNQARNQGNQLVMELGNMVIRAVRTVGQIDHREREIRQMIQQAAKRLGLADDVKFQCLPDGRLRVIADVQNKAPEQQDPPTVSEPESDLSSKELPVDETDAMAAVAQAKAASEADWAKDTGLAMKPGEEADTPPPPA